MRHSSHGPFGSRLGRASVLSCAELSAAVIPLCFEVSEVVREHRDGGGGAGRGVAGRGAGSVCARPRPRAGARAGTRNCVCKCGARKELLWRRRE